MAGAIRDVNLLQGRIRYLCHSKSELNMAHAQQGLRSFTLRWVLERIAEIRIPHCRKVGDSAELADPMAAHFGGKCPGPSIQTDLETSSCMEELRGLTFADRS